MSRLYHLAVLPARLLAGAAGAARSAASAWRYLMYLGLRHRPRADDVFVATYPKSGTTVVQVILHHLLHGGEITHIDLASPWFEIAAVNEPDRLEGLAPPRIVKTHLTPRLLPRRGRFVYVARNPKDVDVSYFHHAGLLGGFRGDLDTFTRRFLAGKIGSYGRWTDHFRAWWRRRGDPDVLFLTYQELRADLLGTVERIARFVGAAADPARLAAVVERSSLASMKAQPEKYDPRFAPRGGAAPGIRFVRRGAVGGWVDELSPESAAAIDREVRRLLDRLGPSPDLDFLRPPGDG